MYLQTGTPKKDQRPPEEPINKGNREGEKITNLCQKKTQKTNTETHSKYSIITPRRFTPTIDCSSVTLNSVYVLTGRTPFCGHSGSEGESGDPPFAMGFTLKQDEWFSWQFKLSDSQKKNQCVILKYINT